jgi:hypothetical protein
MRTVASLLVFVAVFAGHTWRPDVPVRSQGWRRAFRDASYEAEWKAELTDPTDAVISRLARDNRMFPPAWHFTPDVAGCETIVRNAWTAAEKHLGDGRHYVWRPAFDREPRGRIDEHTGLEIRWYDGWCSAGPPWTPVERRVHNIVIYRALADGRLPPKR